MAAAERLSLLRQLMKNGKKTLTAYIIPTDDAHQVGFSFFFLMIGMKKKKFRVNTLLTVIRGENS